MATKKDVSKNDVGKNADPKKLTGKAISNAGISNEVTPPKATPDKPKTSVPISKEAAPEKEILAPGAGAIIPATGDCVCRQKKPNGKFYCYRLIQGRWVQSSGIPFPTKESCEDACC